MMGLLRDPFIGKLQPFKKSSPSFVGPGFCFQLRLPQTSFGSASLKTKSPSLCKGLFEWLAEEEGFEPPIPCGMPVFKTGVINRSTTPLIHALRELFRQRRKTNRFEAFVQPPISLIIPH